MIANALASVFEFLSQLEPKPSCGRNGALNMRGGVGGSWMGVNGDWLVYEFVGPLDTWHFSIG